MTMLMMMVVAVPLTDDLMTGLRKRKKKNEHQIIIMARVKRTVRSTMKTDPGTNADIHNGVVGILKMVLLCHPVSFFRPHNAKSIG